MARSYSPEFRAKALQLLAEGQSVAKVSRDLKVSQSSLRGWKSRPPEPQVAPEPARPKTLLGEVASGDTGRALRALRDTLARAIELGPADRDLAVLSRRLMDVLQELAKLEESVPAPEPVKTPLEQVQEKVANELAARRARKSAS